MSKIVVAGFMKVSWGFLIENVFRDREMDVFSWSKDLLLEIVVENWNKANKIW